MIATTEEQIVTNNRQNSLTVETPQVQLRRGRGRPRKNPAQSPGGLKLVEEGKKQEKVKIKAPDLSGIKPTKESPLVVQFKLESDMFHKTHIPEHKIDIIHAYPTLKDFFQMYLPESHSNPRSHQEKALRFPLAKEIEQTFRESPVDVVLANRGITIVIDSFRYNPETKTASLRFDDYRSQGCADGGSSLAILNKVQRELLESNASLQFLEKGRIHLELIRGLEEKDKLAILAHGRNRSKQLKDFSLANLKGVFDFLKHRLEAADSFVRGKIGFQENSLEDVNILDVLAFLTVFHPKIDEGNDLSPATAYSGRAKLNAYLVRDDLLPGYQNLEPITLDILKLHDTIYSQFEQAYEAGMKGEKTQVRLGRRKGFESKQLTDKKYKLPMTGTESNYRIANGYIMPLLSAFRTLVTYKGENAPKASWIVSPFDFWAKHRAKLVKTLIKQIKEVGKDSPNLTGKSNSIYETMYQTAKLELLSNK